jgi:hypothetical protein
MSNEQEQKNKWYASDSHVLQGRIERWSNTVTDSKREYCAKVSKHGFITLFEEFKERPNRFFVKPP